MTGTKRENKISKVTINYFNEYTEYISSIIGKNPIILNIRIVKETDKDYSTVTYRHYNGGFVDICNFKICIDPMDFFDKVRVTTNDTSTLISFNKNITGVSKYISGKLFIMHHMSHRKPYIIETDCKHSEFIVDNLSKKKIEEEYFQSTPFNGVIKDIDMNSETEEVYSCKCGAKKGKLFYDLSRETGYICPICMTPVESEEFRNLKELIKGQGVSLKELKEAIVNIGTKPE